MNTKFDSYNADDFSQDIDFIQWVRKGKNHKKWITYIKKNPGQSKKIEIAREIVACFCTDNKNQQVTDKEKQVLWLHIKNYCNRFHSPKIRLNYFLKYAAIFLLIFAISATSILYVLRTDNKINEFDSSIIDYSGDAKLILGGGEEFLLNEELVQLQFNEKGDKINIDHDSTIFYQHQTTNDLMAQVVLPYGKRSELQLADGTKVILNSGSRLVFPHSFTGESRKVFLQGEAYFKVAKDNNKPFLINTGTINVTVLGTEFNLRNNESENELEVVLVEGIVGLKENSSFNFLKKEIRLKPNQKAVFNKQNKEILIESGINTSLYTSWKEGFFEFERESMVNVFNKLSRYYNVSFITESSVELNWKFSGKLDLKESLEDVMKVVSEAAPISYRIDEGKVFVTKRLSYLHMR